MCRKKSQMLTRLAVVGVLQRFSAGPGFTR
ncbi:conserved hypothetical protein [Thiomonas arsenitoxydans]|uniref:Uncharacterized protein n=1 Tax=Thiomonas arsenitoxydans (strain DSM 22701 / CIP 110005 / 3As) TaxID=426114 RepID=D6CKT6_THIA3|nr:Hypothetical protein; putative exported protein [Thiomonas arsenitoxydans]CQR29936.1 conserved hypothetical protein [Thiomonas arsenitoxydans]CQR29946.1 conserved hypothetical protein [Thiomonas arsenitoxydans]CQR32595.1 conserved hypothetical protein [Thiomonas arsenitoxydans]